MSQTYFTKTEIEHFAKACYETEEFAIALGKKHGMHPAFEALCTIIGAWIGQEPNANIESALRHAMKSIQRGIEAQKDADRKKGGRS